MSYTMFDPGYSAPTWLVESVRQRIMEVVPAMQNHMLYTVEDLCGEDFWATLTKGQQRMAGRIVAWLVKYRQIPLRHGPFNFSAPYPKKYLVSRY